MEQKFDGFRAMDVTFWKKGLVSKMFLDGDSSHYKLQYQL